MSQPSVQISTIGTENQRVAVIDNFLPNPDQWRAAASLQSFEVLGPYYPGVRSAAPVGYGEAMGPVLGTVLQGVFGYSGRAVLERCYYSLVTTAPDELLLAQRIPHIDGLGDGLMAVLHYLSSSEQCGTAFYRHRSTGFESVDAQRHVKYVAALQNDFVRHGEPPPNYIAGDTEIFEQIGKFSGVYNRALIYSSSLLHCSDTATSRTFSADPALGRLTIASFLKVT